MALPALARRAAFVRTAAACAALAVLLPVLAVAADLQPRTAEAYAVYLEQARRTFLARVESGRVDPPARAVAAGPGLDDGITGVPGGLVHHWIARAFVRGTGFEQALELSRDFAAYPRIYKAVLRSDVLAREDDTYRVRMRLRESEGGITAVFQVVSTVRYVYPRDKTAYVLSHAEEIREVKNPGGRDEQLLTAGRDSGYLWRADTFTRFVAQDGGVFVETETLGLSREFPPLLGWIIEPIARRLGRRSAEGSMTEFLAALARRAPSSSQH